MYTDVAGRVRNVSLAASKPLLPLYEAIINSIQAIEDASEHNGKINITIIRDDKHLFAEQDRSFGEIIGFEVTDNGIGFTDDNYLAFETSDTTYKAKRGGKGIGRFLWLVAFDNVYIESHFLDSEQLMRRRFSFVTEDDGIKNLTCEPSDNSGRTTVIRLIDYKEKYKKQCPKKIDTIAAYIIEHCLEYFIRSNCPQLILQDRSTGETLNLNEMFEKEMVANSKNVHFKVGEQDFYMLHVRLYSAHVKDHLIHYCAHDRVVKSEKLLGRVPDLIRRLEDEDGNDFVYAAYVEGDMLNTSVNSERTEFAVAKDDTELLISDITWADIQIAVVAQCRTFLEQYTEQVRKKKNERIEDFVATDAPMYRPIMKHISDNIDMIDPEIGDDDLDLKLYEAYHDLQVQIKTEGQKLLEDDREEAEDFDRYNAKLSEYFEKVSDINAADLARYVCHRKAILDFLHKQLSIQDDGKYRWEDRIHNIIFPMGKTSDEVDFDGHNLWLVDEKLVYHAFLASDKQLRTMKPLNSDSKKEPDIIVFDKACAFVPADEPPFPSVVIIEFKRPMRDDYTESKNPFVQVREYITEIRSGKARTVDGRDVPVTDNVPFYCYIICDLGKTLEEYAKDFELEKTADGQGFFGFKKHYNAYFEVISYTKMVSDAKKRNAVLFDKLGLPSRIG